MIMPLMHIIITVRTILITLCLLPVILICTSGYYRSIISHITIICLVQRINFYNMMLSYMDLRSLASPLPTPLVTG